DLAELPRSLSKSGLRIALEPFFVSVSSHLTQACPQCVFFGTGVVFKSFTLIRTFHLFAQSKSRPRPAWKPSGEGTRLRNVREACGSLPSRRAAGLTPTGAMGMERTMSFRIAAAVAVTIGTMMAMSPQAQARPEIVGMQSGEYSPGTIVVKTGERRL